MEKSKIINKLLETDYDNNVTMYRLIKSSNSLSILLSKIEKIDEDEFILLFNNLLNMFDDYFPGLNSMKIVICDKLLRLDEMQKYFDKKNLTVNEKIINEIFVKNFIYNLNLVKDNEIIKDFLNENNINLKKYNSKDIINLMKKLIFCSDKLKTSYLFYNINDISNDNKEYYPNSSSKELIENAKKMITNYYKEIIINYDLKKNYLKYFLNE